MEERYCSFCLSCQNDCKRLANIHTCDNYDRAFTLKFYNDEIKVQNVNIRRLCSENGLKYYIMRRMLKGKMVFKYKYRKILENRLLEKDEYLPYIEEGDIV